MSKRYHYNSVTGRANICRAKDGNCPLGSDTPHFDSKQEAKDYVEAQAKNTHKIFSIFSKNKKNDETVSDSQASRDIFTLNEEAEDNLNFPKFKEIIMSPPEENSGGKTFTRMGDLLKATEELHQKLTEDYKNSNTVTSEEFNRIEWSSDILMDYNNNYNKILERATGEELAAIKSYTGLRYMPINDYLRNPEGYKKKISNNSSPEVVREILEKNNKIIGEVDSFIKKAPERDKTVYRYLTQEDDFEASVYTLPDSSEDWVKNTLNYEVGETITFKSFSSTTIDPALIARNLDGKAEHTGVALVINTNKGAEVGLTAVREVDKQYTQDSEREVLLPRNMNFRVDKIERARFIGDGGAVEPLTIFLSEV